MEDSQQNKAEGSDQTPKENSAGPPNDHSNDREEQQVQSADNAQTNKHEQVCPQPFIVKIDKRKGWTIQDITSIIITIISVLALIGTAISLRHSVRAIKVVEESNKQAREQFEASNNPYLQIKDFSAKQTNDDYESFNVTFTIENLTSQPVKIKDVFYRYIISSSPPTRQQINAANFKTDHNISDKYLIKESPYTTTQNMNDIFLDTSGLSVRKINRNNPFAREYAFFYCQFNYVSLVNNKSRVYEFMINLTAEQPGLVSPIVLNENRNE